MNYLSAENLAKTFAERPLFQDLNIGLNEGERVALVGRNGTGKSTLLKILAGVEFPDEGEVNLRKGCRLGYLGQEPKLDESLSIIDNLFVGDQPALVALREYERVLRKMEVYPEDPKWQEAFTKASAEMEAKDAWDYEQRSRQVLGKLGIGQDLDRKAKYLSGGERRRVALARMLIDSPEVLILDEPTNHLDTDAIEWLESLLTAGYVKCLLFVTHDRYFLDNVANNILELSQRKIFGYKGNYQYYLEKKAERQQVEAAEASKAQSLMKKELEWMRRQPKARGTKSRSRIQAFDGIKEKAAGTEQIGQVQLKIRTTRQGSKIAEMHSVCKEFEHRKVLDHFTYTFRKKDRVGVVGPNGVGKSSFLNLLLGKLKPDAGTVKYGETTKFGYYSQLNEPIPDGLRVIEAVNKYADNIDTEDGKTLTASQFLNLFLFPPKRQHDFVEKLSGGERKRLQLLTVLIQNPNFLILDEPTNDLDIDTLQVLEQFLLAFDGTLLIVSHDRYFMDLLVDHLFVFQGEGVVKDFPGNYSDYTLWKKEQEAEAAKAKEAQKKAKAQPEKAKKEKSKLSYHEKQELEGLEKEIPELEKRQTEIADAMSQAGQAQDHEQLKSLSEEAAQLEQDLEAKTERWLELSELAG